MSHPTQAPHPTDMQTQSDLDSLRSIQSALISHMTILLVDDSVQCRTWTLMAGLADLHDVTETLIAHGEDALKRGYDAYDQDLHLVVEGSIGAICAAIVGSEGDVETISTLARGYTTGYNAFDWPDARVSVRDCFEREQRRTQTDEEAAGWAVGPAHAALEDAREARASWDCQGQCEWSSSSGLEQAVGIAMRRYDESRWVHEQVTAALSVLGSHVRSRL